MSQNDGKSPMIWRVNGCEFILDLQDVDEIERFEKAIERMDIAEKALPKDGKASDRMRAYCMMYRNLYDDLFGEGAAQKIFGDTNNARVCNEVYEQFLTFVESQGEVASTSRRRITERYSPNRAQRRANARKKNT